MCSVLKVGIRDLLWATALIAVIFGWWRDRNQQIGAGASAAEARMQKWRFQLVAAQLEKSANAKVVAHQQGDIEINYADGSRLVYPYPGSNLHQAFSEFP